MNSCYDREGGGGKGPIYKKFDQMTDLPCTVSVALARSEPMSLVALQVYTPRSA